MLLRLGTEAKEVRELRRLMQRAGYLVPDADLFDAELDRCVRAYQEDRGLAVDGVVVHRGGKSWPRLAAEPTLEVRPDTSPRAARLSRGLATLYDPERRRMVPEYRSSSIAAWEGMEKGQDHRFVVPLSSDGSGRHGATCGHAAWLLTSWWMRAMHPERGGFPTWRTGRGPTKSMAARFLPLAPVEGVTYGGKLHRGLSDYVSAHVRVAEVAMLADGRCIDGWYVCQKASGHIICVLRIGPDFGCVAPRTGLTAVPGLYRLAADGSKATIGRPWTWRRVRLGETGPWTCYYMTRLPGSSEIESGPLAGAPDPPLVLEG
jgi:hypothetical protein